MKKCFSVVAMIPLHIRGIGHPSPPKYRGPSRGVKKTSHLPVPTMLLGALALIILLGGNALSAPVDVWLRRGNEAYEAQQYDSAVVYYQKIIDAGVTNSAVHYNLGNAYFRLNKKG
ncbi:MAG: hypothetical protein GF344_00075, partial [Chitinivibrionales bacterium]|nr:hypothetical protein [Chitinivibrionales bacterium]MBD3355528.1 hypothetical protein [Chitinivibrionales bacterium]